MNHQHTKEIQRHISNVDSSYNQRFRERPSSIQSAFQQTVSAFKTGIGRAAAPTTAFDSTHSSAFEGQPVSRGPLAEFGLDSTHTDWESESESRFNNINGSSSSVPLLSHVERHLSGNGNDDNNFLVLNRFRMAPKNEGWGAVSDFDEFFTVSFVSFSPVFILLQKLYLIGRPYLTIAISPCILTIIIED